MDKEIIHTTNDGERVTSTYAEIYLDDSYCDFQRSEEENEEIAKEISYEDIQENNWVSPSDLLIGKVELKPPFTSKITRGKTHEGILAIGNGVLEIERLKFQEHLKSQIEENDAAWAYVLEHEKNSIFSKVKVIYDKIFLDKSKIMTSEITKFYEKTLQQLEDHIRSEIQDVLVRVHAGVVSDLNIQIKSKLEKEREIIESALKKRFDSELNKVTKYYSLLLDNELNRNNKLINQAIYERNDALKAFLRQIEAENITSSMYILCTERKKCKIKQFILENYQSMEISEKMKNIAEKQEIIDDLKQKDVGFVQINTEWEEKIKKILKLFLKFITFGLKLLPEQSTFLLDLEKMVVLQLNEIQKSPKAMPILIDDVNIFKFEEPQPVETVCEKDPFIIVGDESPTPPPKFGSRETIPPDIELPFVRLNRQFIYAKCHKFEEVKAFLESQRCKCADQQVIKRSSSDIVEQKPETTQFIESEHESESSNETLRIDDFGRFNACPARNCQDWLEKLSFPYLNNYLDYTEENYERLQAIIGKKTTQENQSSKPETINARDVVYRQVPFSATKELYHHVGTQCSSMEDLTLPDIRCPCVDGATFAPQVQPPRVPSQESKHIINEILANRKRSLQRLIEENPKLLRMFTDECYDFQF